ncbi:hypothetical protein R80B4_02248 [Fibrobacteres bacterium R8-0-B4]
MIATSEYSTGRMPLLFSITSVTSAMLSGARFCVPEKMTSCILALRSAEAFCSPKTQRMASTTLLLPHPLGPMTAVIPSPKSNSVLSAKDLKPKIESFRKTIGLSVLFLTFLRLFRCFFDILSPFPAPKTQPKGRINGQCTMYWLGVS